jgi:dCTP deaminase
MAVMRVLSDKSIKLLFNCGELSITPLDSEQIQPASVDIRLGDTFVIAEDSPDGIVTLDLHAWY